MTRVGVGHSARRRAGDAGRDAARAALAALGGVRADVVLVFANAGYDQTELLAAIRDLAGRDTLLCGCSSSGIIFRGGSNEQACAVNVLAWASDRIVFDAFNVAGFMADPAACGAAIARRVGDLGPERAKAVLLMPDGLTGNTTALLRSLDAHLPFPVTVAGGAAGAFFRVDLSQQRTSYQYLDGTVITDSVSVLIIGGAVAVDVAVSHGCTPIGRKHEVTATDGGWLHEIDGRPAWDVLREYVDGDPDDLQGIDVVHLCIGEPLHPDLRAAYGADYLIRTPVVLSNDKRSLFFPGGLQLGTKIQFTRRDPALVVANAEQSALALARRRPGHCPLAVLQFDCAGRGYMLFGETFAAAAILPLQRAFKNDPPWFGLHTLGEIAQIGARSFYHNYTVALCAIYEC